MCPHEGFYTCVGRYDRSSACLVYVMVCDECQEVVERVSEQEYQPHYVPLRVSRLVQPAGAPA